jgi:hypothetical protein
MSSLPLDGQTVISSLITTDLHVFAEILELFCRPVVMAMFRIVTTSLPSLFSHRIVT